MENGNEIFKHFSDDPEFIEKSIAEDPPLCMIINNDLNPAQINELTRDYYMFVVEYGGEQRLGAAGGFYKQKKKRFDKLDPEKVEKCKAAQKWVESGEETEPVLDKLLEDPLCILIAESLKGVRLEMLRAAYEVIETQYNFKNRIAIACAYMNPHLQVASQVIAQEFVGES